MDPNLSKYVDLLLGGSSSEATPTSSENPNPYRYSQSQNQSFHPYSQSSSYEEPYTPHSYDLNDPLSPPSQLFTAHCSMAPPTHIPAAGKKRRPELAPIDLGSKLRRAWVVAEDKALIAAYLHTSNDAIVGVDQSGATFWQKVTSSFAANTSATTAARDKASCKNRWHHISASVSKFVGAYKQATARKTSGQNENDVLGAALSIYEADMNKKFVLEHAWRMLKNDPKWMLPGDDCASKRSRLNQQGNYSSSSPGTPSTPCTPTTPSEAPPSEDAPTEDQAGPSRPIGVKAAKRKAKEKARTMPTVNEGAPGPRDTLMSTIAAAQDHLATAMEATARTKKMAIYSKLLRKATRSEEEATFLSLLRNELGI